MVSNDSDDWDNQSDQSDSNSDTSTAAYRYSQIKFARHLLYGNDITDPLPKSTYDQYFTELSLHTDSDREPEPYDDSTSDLDLDKDEDDEGTVVSPNRTSYRKINNFSEDYWQQFLRYADKHSGKVSRRVYRIPGLYTLLEFLASKKSNDTKLNLLLDAANCYISFQYNGTHYITSSQSTITLIMKRIRHNLRCRKDNRTPYSVAYGCLLIDPTVTTSIKQLLPSDGRFYAGVHTQLSGTPTMRLSHFHGDAYSLVRNDMIYNKARCIEIFAVNAGTLSDYIEASITYFMKFLNQYSGSKHHITETNDTMLTKSHIQSYRNQAKDKKAFYSTTVGTEIKSVQINTPIKFPLLVHSDKFVERFLIPEGHNKSKRINTTVV